MRLCYTVATPETSDPTMLALREPMESAFVFLAEAGYTAAELMVRDPAELDSAGIRNSARDAGVAIAAVSTGQLRKEDGLSFTHPEDPVRRWAVERTCRVIDFAAALGAQVNIGSLRGHLGADRAKSRLRADACFRAVLEHAASAGVAVAVEAQCRYVVDWLTTVEETLSFREEIGHPVGLLWDVYHAALEEESMYASLVRAHTAGALLHVQFSDSNRRHPGCGQFPLIDLARVLDALDYPGWVAIECLQGPDARVTARRAAAYFRDVVGPSRLQPDSPAPVQADR